MMLIGDVDPYVYIDGDFDAVSKIASIVGNLEDPPIICGLARSVKKDIEACYEATKAAKFPRLHVFIAASDLHMEYKLKKTRPQVSRHPSLYAYT